MDEDEDVSQTVATNETILNTLMEISQQNDMAIQNLTEDITIINETPEEMMILMMTSSLTYVF